MHAPVTEPKTPFSTNALAAADVVHVTRFSKNVNGTVPGFTGSVTVDLLRNSIGANGAVVRNQVDTFTTTVGGGGVWSGAFTSHAFASGFDEVEVNYNGTPAQGQVTIGGDNAKFLPAASVAPAHIVDAPPDRLDGNLGVQSDGARMQVGTCGHRVAEPSCDFYMTTREFVCHNLTPGLYAGDAGSRREPRGQPDPECPVASGERRLDPVRGGLRAVCRCAGRRSVQVDRRTARSDHADG